MVHVFAELLNISDSDSARQVFRSIINQRTRLDLMRNALECWPAHQHKPQELDDILSEFAALNTARNQYLHGLWYTHNESGRVFLVDETEDYDYFHKRREVKPNALLATLKRMTAFIRRIRNRQGGTAKEPNPEPSGPPNENNSGTPSPDKV
jgi:hypothetical protein